MWGTVRCPVCAVEKGGDNEGWTLTTNSPCGGFSSILFVIVLHMYLPGIISCFWGGRKAIFVHLPCKTYLKVESWSCVGILFKILSKYTYLIFSSSKFVALSVEQVLSRMKCYSFVHLSCKSRLKVASWLCVGILFQILRKCPFSNIVLCVEQVLSQMFATY
jgi:hypothetical protein